MPPPPRKRREEPSLSWPFPPDSPVSPQALDQADRLQWLNSSSNRDSAHFPSMASEYSHSGFQPGIASSRHSVSRAFPVNFQGLPALQNRERANPQVTTGYLVPYSRRQNAGSSSNNNNNNNNGNTNANANANANIVVTTNANTNSNVSIDSMASLQGASPAESTGAFDPLIGFYPSLEPDRSSDSPFRARTFNLLNDHRTPNNAVTGSPAARPSYGSHILQRQQIQQRQENLEPRMSPAFSAAPAATPHQAHRDSTNPPEVGSTPFTNFDINEIMGSNLDTEPSYSTLQELMQERELNQGQGQESESFLFSLNPAVPTTAAATTATTTAATPTAHRRRSAQDMASSENEPTSQQAQGSGEGLYQRRVRMRTLRVSPASSTQQPPPPSSSQPQPQPQPAPTSNNNTATTTTSASATATAATATTASATPNQRPIDPIFGYHHPNSNSSTFFTYMDAMNRHMASRMDSDQRLQMLREYQQRETLRRRAAARNPQPTEQPVGLDVQTDGRPEPKDSASLMVNMECKVCMTQLVDTVLIPCGHAVLCRWCAEQHLLPKIGSRRLPPACPMCRRPIKQRLRMFIS
ncbi:hypothetical protein MGYG_03762 [Nannizzia gypsea CBS 118893]|uniref:RING-type domain-containing protein n=1 Tax=Arthroderma gypseum (strain ATCC MYA-4604 / CBS 118893) TaxID=535722 RepID=E4UTV2_ARTGP|nr:hypothetical protein MGYG_03762 [Nannizzia gypsea CBS 118893]EFR00758.1 hypothetical protein MGYG_03762 [Nannizzia gypsea CBS 118893]